MARQGKVCKAFPRLLTGFRPGCYNGQGKEVNPPLPLPLNELLRGLSMLIPVKNLRSICDPFSQSPWWGYSISHTLIQYCIDNNLLLPEPYDEANLYHYTKRGKWGEANGHVARVAYFVKNYENFKEPISIDVGVPCLGCHVDWIILDGNHRFAAALFMGLDYIEAEVSGQVDYAEEILGCCMT